MSNILCIETGTDTCSVALAADGALVALRESHGERDHAARVAVYTGEVLAEAGVTTADLSAVAVSRGPGSYTGLRIGVSFAKGLCYGLGVPLIGVGSLDSLCRMAITNYELRKSSYARLTQSRITNLLPSDSPPLEGCPEGAGWLLADGINVQHNTRGFSPTFLIPMIDARRMEVYAQVFDAGGTALTEPEALVIDGESLAGYRDRGVWIFGSGAEKCREALSWAQYIDVMPSARGMISLAFRALEAGDFENTAYFEPFYLKDFVVTTSKKKLF